MDTPNTYTDGTSGVQGTVLGSRPSDVTQEWTTTVNGQPQTAVALSLDTTFVDGLQHRADTDLSYQTPGDIPFGLTRYYSSASPVAGPLRLRLAVRAGYGGLHPAGVLHQLLRQAAQPVPHT